MIRLAIYLPDLSSGGVERMRLNLIPELKRRQVEVTLILERRNGALLSQTPKDVEVIDLGVSRNLQALFPLARLLRKRRFDVLMSSLGHNNIIAVWARFLARVNTAVIICQHNALGAEQQFMSGWQYKILPFLYRVFGAQADAVVGVSKGVAQDLIQRTGLAEDKVKVIYNPVVTDAVLADIDQPVEHPWFLDPGLFIYVAVGRLVEQKDFASLIHAFAQLPAREDKRLMILGEGPLLSALKSLAESLGCASLIDFAGFRTSPMAYVARCHAMVMSSQYEGFGNVLVEGLACGVPIVSTDCPFGPREILEDGRYGHLVPVGDVAALAQAMTAVYSETTDRTLLKQRALEYSASAIADIYVALFGRTISRRKSEDGLPEVPSVSRMNRRIGIYLPTLRVGGAEIVMSRIARGLQRQGYELSFIIDRHMDKELLTPGLPVHALGVNRVARALWPLMRLLYRRQFDIVITATPYNSVMALLANMLVRYRTQVIVTEHCPVSLLTEGSGPRNTVLRWLIRRFYPKASRLVAVSQGVKQDLQNAFGIAPHQVTVISNPVLDDNAGVQVTEPVSGEWFERQDLKVILAVGRLSQEKDFATLMRAFSRVYAKDDSARLLILGEGEDRATLEALARELGIKDKVALPGNVRNPYAFMANCQVFVSSSRYEGFGNVLIEAMFAGAPVITTDCPVGPREITDNGRWGILVPPGDDARMAEEISRVLSGERVLERAPLEWLKARYSVASSVQAYHQLLSQMA